MSRRPSPLGVWTRRPLAWLTLLVFSFALAPAPEAQDIVEQLRNERRQARLDELAAEAAERPLEARPLHFYPQTNWALAWMDARDDRQRQIADSVAGARADSLARVAQTLDELDWRKTAPDAQNAFLEEHGETFWRAVGTSVPIDTMQTLGLRGRLTQLFGTPTRNAAAAAQEQYAGSEFVQFEYWLVVNDSIPLLVLDTAGPFGRGLLIAGASAQAEWLPYVKRDLSERLLAASPTVQFVDYYHDYDRKTWFKAGYDGEDFFTQPIRTPRWVRNFVGNKWLIHR